MFNEDQLILADLKIKYFIISHEINNTRHYLDLPSSTSIPSCFKSSLNLWISSFNSLISLALASSLTTALHLIALARSAYLKVLKNKTL